MTRPAHDTAPARPSLADQAGYEAAVERLRVREKAHTREGSAIAAARRRLPAVEVDASLPVAGADGPVRLLEVFEGRRLLVAYYFMWHAGQPAARQCEGCTFFTSQVRELSTLHARDTTYATICEGPFAESDRYRAFMGWEQPWYSVGGSGPALLHGRPFGSLVCYLRDGDRVLESCWSPRGRGLEVMAPAYGLLDLTPYGRQETWEDSPAGWPQPFTADGSQFATDGRPSAQWARLATGASDDLGTPATDAAPSGCCH